MSPFIDLSDLDTRELMPGFHGKFIHSDRMTVVFWTIDAGAELPEHAHPHEQFTTVLEGQFEMTVAGETSQLAAGKAVMIPSNAAHSGKALTTCRIVDVFQPPRDEYR